MRVKVLGYSILPNGRQGMNGTKSNLKITNIIVEEENLEDYKNELKSIYGVHTVFLYYTENLEDDNFLKHKKELKQESVKTFVFKIL